MKDRNAPCIEARDLAERHLEAVQLKLAELKALETIDRRAGVYVYVDLRRRRRHRLQYF